MANLPKRERLRNRDRIGELFESGCRGSCGTVAARALPNGLPHTRLLAVAGKGLGNAVLRNRLRRRIKAAYRLLKTELPRGYDVAVLARRGLAECEWLVVMSEVKTAAEKAVRSADGRLPSQPHR